MHSGGRPVKECNEAIRAVYSDGFDYAAGGTVRECAGGSGSRCATLGSYTAIIWTSQRWRWCYYWDCGLCSD